MPLAKQTFTALAVLALSAGPSLAQDPGQVEYLQACAACHGETGAGGGPLAQLMKVEMPDLTQLSAGNNGAFPMAEIIQIIDGRTGVRSHGGPMPVWGDRFKAEAVPIEGAYRAELAARGRVLSVAYYLETLQQ